MQFELVLALNGILRGRGEWTSVWGYELRQKDSLLVTIRWRSSTEESSRIIGNIRTIPICLNIFNYDSTVSTLSNAFAKSAYMSNAGRGWRNIRNSGFYQRRICRIRCCLRGMQTSVSERGVKIAGLNYEIQLTDVNLIAS